MRCFFVLPAILLFSTNFSHSETVAERAFAALEKNPPPAANSFSFVVLGDSRATEPYAMPPVFHQMIREWNVLKPAFVVDVGDLILGGAADGVDAQWEVFENTIAACEAPFIPMPGNHDVTDPATEEIYTRRIGPMRGTFSYGNSQFIALNSEEHGQVNTLSQAQLDWLKTTLETSTAGHIFVFIHKPYFLDDWDASWADVHKILKPYPVRIVFGCDKHLYRDCGTHDGIRYVVSGGGGAEIRTPEEEGGFNHYLLVNVQGDDVNFAVIRPGNVLPPDTVTKERIDEIHALQAAMYTDTVRVPLNEGFKGKVNLHIRNPYPDKIVSEVHWHTPAGWKVTPNTKKFNVAPGHVAALEFQIASAGAALFPVPEFECAVANTMNKSPITVRKKLNLIPTLEAHAKKSDVTPDGILSEWKKIPKIPLGYGWDFDIKDTKDLRAFFQMQWDTENFYLAVTVVDDEFSQPYAGDIVWSADGLQLFLGDWEWGLSLTSKGEEVFLYGGPGRERETVNSTVNLGVKRDGKTTTYEAAFPLSEVAPLKLEAGSTFQFSLVANDFDPSVPERPRHWAELTPGIGNAVPNSPMAEVLLKGK